MKEMVNKILIIGEKTAETILINSNDIIAVNAT